jgi:uncharacterized protein (DUF983 family)
MEQSRNIKKALKNGWKQKCPKCGCGSLYYAYLKTKNKCIVCEQEIHHHRADDGPAYLTILFVGHVLAPFLVPLYKNFNPDPLVVATSFSILAIAMSLYLLPRLKGAIIAYQWAKYMGGFNIKNDAAYEPTQDIAEP